jgi:uncharacterized protein
VVSCGGWRVGGGGLGLVGPGRCCRTSTTARTCLRRCISSIAMRRTHSVASSYLARSMTTCNGWKNKTFASVSYASSFSTAANDDVAAVTITQHTSSSKNNFSRNNHNIHTNNQSMELVDSLLLRTSEMMNPYAANVVAYSGGVDSSLVAALVHRVFSGYEDILSPNNSNKRGTVQAVLGISHAVPQTQIDVARKVANSIGIPLMEVSTAEGSDEAYIRNDGHACFVCKTHLYSTLNAVADAFMEQYIDDNLDGLSSKQQKVILYNGTNADDTLDPTRLGLLAASNFSVHSPLNQITKDQVRQAAKYLGLSNWNAAASPCLRSRLAMGVMATEEHLRAVEMAEAFVREVLGLDDTINARVRMLSGGKAMVELDNSIIESVDDHDLATKLIDHGFSDKCINEWGFKKFGGVREFKTGSVAAMPEDQEAPLAAATLY